MVFLSALIASIIHLQVSTVGDKVITLPKDTASLYASAWPKETSGKIEFIYVCIQDYRILHYLVNDKRATSTFRAKATLIIEIYSNGNRNIHCYIIQTQLDFNIEHLYVFVLKGKR